MDRRASARPVAGMLLNFRAANAIFDDENPATRSLWSYRDKQNSNGQLRVSASLSSPEIPTQAMRLASDFFLLRGNGLTPSAIALRISQLKATAEYQAAPRPIIYNEDSTSIPKMDVAISNGAGWGFHDKGLNDYHDGFQSPLYKLDDQYPNQGRFF